MTIDLSDIYDNCYSGYEDFAAELVLQRSKRDGKWQNDDIEFFKHDTLKWAYRTCTGKWNYGYDSLKDAVVKYTGGLASDSAPESSQFIASRLCDVQYTQKLSPKTSEGYIYCKVTRRLFLPECDNSKVDYVNQSLSNLINELVDC